MIDSYSTGVQGATKLLFYLVIALSPTSAYSSTISYSASNISGNTWRYDYVLTNDTPGSTINEFTIFFDLGLYSTLSVFDSPAQWDSLVVQPDPNIPDNGFFDALALSSGLAFNDSISGFSVSFNWLGAGTPGSQTFNVVDPQTFAVLETGQTQSTVPEPNTASLLSLGLLGLLLSMGARQLSVKQAPNAGINSSWLIRRCKKATMKCVSRVIFPLFAIVGWIAAPPLSHAAAHVLGIELVRSIRTDRTTFDYIYRVRIQNGIPALSNARAVATSMSPAITVLNGSVNLGNLSENSTVTSTETVTFRVNRETPFDNSAISWRVLSDESGAIPRLLAQLEASGQIPVLDRSATVSGPDDDHNSVRDDIDNYVNDLPDAAPQKMALRQIARGIGNALVAGSQDTSKSVLEAVSTEIKRAVHCIYLRYDPEIANRKVADMKKFLANTRTRFDAYDQYSAKISGTWSRLPSGDSCEEH